MGKSWIDSKIKKRKAFQGVAKHEPSAVEENRKKQSTSLMLIVVSAPYATTQIKFAVRTLFLKTT